eukprot:TRINITY_DN20306_c0_g1_i1.p1 TRINITY_DN20306_c0_g1~~TRINITY_DN20306_c0_g1_i1.p1  ORF type:complete len:132 (-),score=60.64 TRINITY_DN20306_c0_g1_i1:10-372(-)
MCIRDSFNWDPLSDLQSNNYETDKDSKPSLKGSQLEQVPRYNLDLFKASLEAAREKAIKSLKNFIEAAKSVKQANIEMKSSYKNKNWKMRTAKLKDHKFCLLYTSPSPRDLSTSRMPSSA